MIYGNILTGGIACGKSTVANLLKLEGFSIIDADVVSHRVLDENQEVVISHFGSEILQDSVLMDFRSLGKIDSSLDSSLMDSVNRGFNRQDCIKKDSKTAQINRIDRKKLGKIIFNDDNKKRFLESILHPLIQKEIEGCCQILESKQKPYFMDIPLYFEGLARRSFMYSGRFVVCVYAPKTLQIQRLIQRDNLDSTQALKRIDSQIDIETKREKSDFVIENTRDLKALQRSVESFLAKFREVYEA